MRASELRIGNYINIHVKDNPLIHEVHTVGPTTLMILTGEVDRKQIDLNPIPLTREWLGKFKFYQKYTSDPQERNCSEAYFIHEFTLHTTSGSLKFFFYSNEGLCIEVKHVHQLQNLYFALTGEELTTE